VTRLRTLLPAIGLGFLSACGGGGGGGLSQYPAMSVTSTNVQNVTAVVFDSQNIAEGSSGGASFITGVTGGAGHSQFRFADFALQQLERIAAQAVPAGTLTGVTVSGGWACTGIGGGTVSYLATFSDPSATYLMPGDSFSVQFTQCHESGTVLDGVFAFTISSVSANFDPASPVAPYDLAIDTTMSNFSANDGIVNVFVNGDMSIAISDDGAGLVDVDLSGSQLGGKDGTETVVLTGYDYMLSADSVSGDFTYDAAATVGSSKLNGSVTFQTTTPFTGNDGTDGVSNGNPTAGVLVITTSKDSSSATVTAQPDGVNVQIDLVDSDGNPSTIMTTWDDLAAL